MCCTWLGENTGHKNDAKNRYLGTIPQLCRAISSQLRHVSTIGKKIVKQQYLLHMSPQYGGLRPTSGWDRFGSLGHRSYFQRLPRLGIVTARQSSSERQPNFAALNRGRHLCSAGRPSRWALAHISSHLSFTHFECWYHETFFGWLIIAKILLLHNQHFYLECWLVKAKFHYAILVADTDRSEAGRIPASSC